MAIRRDPAEWFHSPHRADDVVVYGIVKTKGEWLVLRKTYMDFGESHTDRIAQAPTREGAIGFIKLLKEDK